MIVILKFKHFFFFFLIWKFYYSNDQTFIPDMHCTKRAMVEKIYTSVTIIRMTISQANIFTQACCDMFLLECMTLNGNKENKRV